MRLVDADALKEKYHIDLGEEVAPTVDCHDCEKIRAEIRNAVDDMKAQPEKAKGKWIKDTSFKCSNCGRYGLEWGGEVVKSDFCPSCGADMRGGE